MVEWLEVWRLLLGFYGCLSVGILAAQERPNIVFFIVDDLGWQDTSVAFGEPSGFQQHFRTPRLQELARQGVVWTQAYACPVCTPTRASIMTGQNAARHQITNWILYADRETSGQTDHLQAPKQWRRQGLQPDDPFLARFLREAGYATIHCGKAHWGAVGTQGSDPKNLGFDVNIAGHAAGAPGSYLGEKAFGNQPDNATREPWGVPGLENYHGSPIHLTEALTQEACRELTIAVNEQKKPFFLWMAHYAVHTPIEAQPRFLNLFQGKHYPGSDQLIPDKEAAYASMVAGVDESLGQLLDHLNRLQVAQNTLIVFTSDNGGLSATSRGRTWRGTEANTHNWPLREGKGSAYEGGIRVPLIISWARPDLTTRLQQQIRIRGGERCEVTTLCEDHFPTVLNWAGIPVTKMTHPIEGQDLTSFLSHPSTPSERELIFHYPHVWGPRGAGYQPYSAIRKGNWKAIYFYQDQRWELYDLGRDVGESHDLAAAEPAQLQTLAGRLRTILEERGALFPFDTQTGQSATLKN